MRRRGEVLERPFAHCLTTGGMRRTHLRGHENILKRILIHTAGFNLARIMEKLIGFGKPRALQGLSRLAETLYRLIWAAQKRLVRVWRFTNGNMRRIGSFMHLGTID